MSSQGRAMLTIGTIAGFVGGFVFALLLGLGPS